jgi:glycosyltransferase involved in cell wall biosynthesis
MARVAIGLPLYNGGPHFREALDTLAGQTFSDFGVVVVDDMSTDSSPEVAQRLAEVDDRITYSRNRKRLGLTLNWRNAFEAARREHPDAEFFAWGSDHDVWHPRWLEAMVDALDADPEAMLAFPLAGRLEPDLGVKLRRSPMEALDGMTLRETVETLSERLRAGYLVYGLSRVDAMESIGVFHHVLYADRLAITQLALRGSLREVDEWLWYKRPTGEFSTERQLRSCFPDGVPWYGKLPWWLTHGAVLVWWLTVKGAGGAKTSRASGPAAAVLYTWFAATRKAREKLRMNRRTRSR